MTARTTIRVKSSQLEQTRVSARLVDTLPANKLTNSVLPSGLQNRANREFFEAFLAYRACGLLSAGLG